MRHFLQEKDVKLSWVGASLGRVWLTTWCGCSVASDSFVTPWTTVPKLLCPRNSLGKNTGVGCYFLLQGIFPPQGSNPRLLCLLHWQVDFFFFFFFTTVPPGKPSQASEGSSMGHVEHCSTESRWHGTVAPASTARRYMGMLAHLSSPAHELTHHTYMSTTCVNTLSTAQQTVLRDCLGTSFSSQSALPLYTD